MVDALVAASAVIARLTLSRGSSSSTKRSPWLSRSSAPWPRSASDSSGRGIAGWCSAVGWNCTNSTSATATPARSAMAMPSPVDSVRVGGDGEELAGAAGGHQDVPGPDLGRRRRPACRAVDPGAAAALDDQVEGEPVLVARAAAVRRTAATSARSISAPVAAPPACTTRASEWPPSRASSSSPCGVPVEDGAEGDQLVDPGRPLVDEHPHRVGVAQPGAGGQGVGQVEVGRVGVAAQHRGHPALRPPGGGLGQLALGQDADPQPVDVGRPHRGRQAGDAGPEDQQVEVRGIAPTGGGQLAGTST